jgi:rfaE bifunctional protein nucleotidyltransferase chain/domain
VGDSFPAMSLEKLKTPAELAAISERMGADKRKLVFTNGCFDLLHAGHVRYLQQARALGNALVVALNGDASVRALKGPTRPINGEQDRAEVLGALACVDYVTIFQSERVTDLVAEIRPQVYAKGGDYTVDSLDPGERSALENVGAEIKILPLVPGKSTTNIIKKWQS